MKEIEVKQRGRNAWMAVVHAYFMNESYQLKGEFPDIRYWFQRNVKGPFHYHTYMLASGLSHWNVHHYKKNLYLIPYSQFIGLISNHGQLEHLTECYGKRDSYCLVEYKDLSGRSTLGYRKYGFFPNMSVKIPKSGGSYELVAKFRRIPRKFIRELAR